MSFNPFQSPSILNTAFPLELCQELHYRAVQRTLREHASEDVPETLPVHHLRSQAYWYGGDALMLHPAEIDNIFYGVTSAVYRMIETLYCDRLGRTIKTVWRILNAMAEHAQVEPISYEAVWTLCVHLSQRRVARTRVFVKNSGTPWSIGLVRLKLCLQTRDHKIFIPSIVCVFNPVEQIVLAFRLARPGFEVAEALFTLYDALVFQRVPLRRAPGILWHIPSLLHVPEALSNIGPLLTRNFGLVVASDEKTSPLIEDLQGNWSNDIAGRLLGEEQFNAVIDTYLAYRHRLGPLSERKRREQKWMHLPGYNRDPASQWSALRELLPEHLSVVENDRTITYENLHYESPYLKYFVGQPVILRQSAYTEARIWVYLDGQIMCEAMARELRRPDGTYRPYRFVK